jgi:hypothetical protein
MLWKGLGCSIISLNFFLGQIMSQLTSTSLKLLRLVEGVGLVEGGGNSISHFEDDCKGYICYPCYNCCFGVSF